MDPAREQLDGLADRIYGFIAEERFDDALGAIDEAIDINRGLDSLRARLDRGELLANKAAALGQLNRDADALRVLDEAIAAQRALMPDVPDGESEDPADGEHGQRADLRAAVPPRQDDESANDDAGGDSDE